MYISYEGTDPSGDGEVAGVPGRVDMQMCSSANPLCADGPRYRALGNAVAVPVIEWIGKRIMMLTHEP